MNTRRIDYNTSLIPNSIVEELFLRIASDENMQEYNRLIKVNTGLATSYASRILKTIFYQFLKERR